MAVNGPKNRNNTVTRHFINYSFLPKIDQNLVSGKKLNKLIGINQKYSTIKRQECVENSNLANFASMYYI